MSVVPFEELPGGFQRVRHAVPPLWAPGDILNRECDVVGRVYNRLARLTVSGERLLRPWAADRGLPLWIEPDGEEAWMSFYAEEVPQVDRSGKLVSSMGWEREIVEGQAVSGALVAEIRPLRPVTDLGVLSSADLGIRMGSVVRVTHPRGRHKSRHASTQKGGAPFYRVIGVDLGVTDGFPLRLESTDDRWSVVEVTPVGRFRGWWLSLRKKTARSGCDYSGMFRRTGE